MAHIHGRNAKNIESQRPLKSTSRSSLKSYMVVEEIIQLIENVALNLQNGIISPEQMSMMVQNLKINGPQVEAVAKEPLDRAFVVFRNASQDERLNIMTRLNLLELIELRAKSWVENGINTYYKSKHASELPEAQLLQLPQYVHTTHAASDGTYTCTSPSFGGGATAGGINNLSETVAANAAIIASVGSPQQTHLLLNPGEVIRNSGTFPKPTKIPGKPYCKDEVVIRNSDSGKVMGIKGRRVHMIEELSETIISFQRVNPGAKERFVQITGPAEDKINYAKQLIEDTIRRNASPVRWEPAPAGATGGGSCSSLASSNSDEHVQLRSNTANNTLTNRLSFNSSQNFMTAAAAAQNLAAMQNQAYMNMAGNQMISAPTGPAPMAIAAGKNMRPSQQILLHSYSTNDASVGEYKYTVTVGPHIIKITGDSCDLVRSAKLVLDDYFSSSEFLASREAGGAFDGNVVSPISTPTTPLAPGPHYVLIGNMPLKSSATPLADSGVGLNYMAANCPNEGEDEVFVEANAASNGGLVRSRRSHFSRKESSPDNATSNVSGSKGNKKPATAASTDKSSRIVIERENLLYYAQSPHSWSLPADWARICEKFPYLVRNKDETDESNRFDGEKYLKLMQSSSKRELDLDGNDETTEDTDDPSADNE